MEPLTIIGGLAALALFRKPQDAITMAAAASVPPTSEKLKLILKLADQYKIPAAVALAVAVVESGGGSGFAKSGRMIIRFEPHIFERLTEDAAYGGKKIESPQGSHSNQTAEWSRFEAAAKLNPKAAMASISMGMFQIMGFNHKLVGYDSVQDMFQAYSTSQEAQIRGFFEFCTKSSGNTAQGNPSVRLDEAARTGNWLAFARGYNGKKQVGYDKKIANQYAVFTKQGYKGIA